MKPGGGLADVADGVELPGPGVTKHMCNNWEKKTSFSSGVYISETL